MSDREMIEETKKDVPDQMEPVIPEIPAEKSGKEPEVEAAEAASIHLRSFVFERQIYFGGWIRKSSGLRPLSRKK